MSPINYEEFVRVFREKERRERIDYEMQFGRKKMMKTNAYILREYDKYLSSFVHDGQAFKLLLIDIRTLINKRCRSRRNISTHFQRATEEEVWAWLKKQEVE
jgi:hypothetical protein